MSGSPGMNRSCACERIKGQWRCAPTGRDGRARHPCGVDLKNRTKGRRMYFGTVPTIHARNPAGLRLRIHTWDSCPACMRGVHARACAVFRVHARCFQHRSAVRVHARWRPGVAASKRRDGSPRRRPATAGPSSAARRASLMSSDRARLHLAWHLPARIVRPLPRRHHGPRAINQKPACYINVANLADIGIM